MGIMECHWYIKYVLQKACALEHHFNSSLFAVLKPVLKQALQHHKVQFINKIRISNFEFVEAGFDWNILLSIIKVYLSEQIERGPLIIFTSAKMHPVTLRSSV